MTENLDRDFASEFHVLGKIDDGHTTRAELLKNSVMRDLLDIPSAAQKHKSLSHKKAQISCTERLHYELIKSEYEPI